MKTYVMDLQENSIEFKVHGKRKLDYTYEELKQFHSHWRFKDITELKTIIPKNLGGYSTDLSRIPVDFIYYRSTPEKEDWMCRLRYLNNRTFTNHGCDSQYIKSFEPEFDERLDKYLEGEEGRERSIVERYMRLLRINRSMNIIRKRKKTFILDGNDFFDMDDFEGD